jgi:hypothetical protein
MNVDILFPTEVLFPPHHRRWSFFKIYIYIYLKPYTQIPFSTLIGHISWVERELEANFSNFLPTILSIISPKTRRKLKPWWHSRSRKPFYPKSHASHMNYSHLRTYFSWTQPYEWNTTYVDGDDSTPIRSAIDEPLAYLRLWYYTISRGQRVYRAKIKSSDPAAPNPLPTAPRLRLDSTRPSIETAYLFITRRWS